MDLVRTATMTRVFALVVGIDRYQWVATLGGGVRDAASFEEFLRARIRGELHVMSLHDLQGTRAAIVEGLSDHLGRAQDDDVALFFFAGHGSFEKVDPKLWYLEPSRQSQTIVAVDSRGQGVPDISDKEINLLLGEVASRGAHVVAVLDCCHAGSGTREPTSTDVLVRQIPGNQGTRDLDSYLPGLQSLVSSGKPLRSARQVTLAACQHDQTAKELVIEGMRRGAFTTMLLRALAALPPAGSYRQLLADASVRVRDMVVEQYPVLYATVPDDADVPFLGGSATTRDSAIGLEWLHGEWSIDVGAVHGIVPLAPGVNPEPGTTTVLEVLDPRTDLAQSHPLGRALVTHVGITRSSARLVGSWSPPEDIARLHAVVVDLPTPGATVQCTGAPAGLADLRAALAHCPNVVEAPDRPVGVAFRVVATEGELNVLRPDGSRVFGPLPATSDGASLAAWRLDHLARWHRTRTLANPWSPLTGDVDLQLVAATSTELPRPDGWTPIPADSSGDIRLAYQASPTGPEPPYVFGYITNRSSRDLYCAVLNLTDSYRCHSRLFPGDLVPAGMTAVLYEGGAFDFSLPADRWSSADATVRDWLLLVASEERFSSIPFEQADISSVVGRGGVRGEISRQGHTTIARLALTAPNRDAGGKDPLQPAPSWVTRLVSVSTSAHMVHARA